MGLPGLNKMVIPDGMKKGIPVRGRKLEPL